MAARTKNREPWPLPPASGLVRPSRMRARAARGAPIVTVRSVELRDVGRLVAMCDALNAHSGLPTGRLDPKSYRAALFGKDAFLFAEIAEAGGDGKSPRETAGYVLAHDAFTTDFGERGMYIVDLYVEPEWRRAGVGRSLMAASAVRAKARGATHLWWASMPANYPARRFYASLGATDERIHSHAVFGEAFKALASKGERLHRNGK